jgi:hypothetical protein
VRPGVRQLYVAPLLSSELGRVVVPHIPTAVKRALRGGVRLLRAALRRAAAGPRPRATPDAPAAAAAPAATAETAALHTCRWRLPQDKARRRLGYLAPVSFEEGCRRSVEWLKRRAEQA